MVRSVARNVARLRRVLRAVGVQVGVQALHRGGAEVRRRRKNCHVCANIRLKNK